jgi:hypothetical protein
MGRLQKITSLVAIVTLSVMGAAVAARFPDLPPKFHGEWCQANFHDASETLLKPCKEVSACKDVRAGSCFRIHLHAKGLTLKSPAQVACTATHSLPTARFEGDTSTTWTVRYSCEKSKGPATFKLVLSEDPRRGAYLRIQSDTESARLFQYLENQPKLPSNTIPKLHSD